MTSLRHDHPTRRPPALLPARGAARALLPARGAARALATVAAVAVLAVVASVGAWPTVAAAQSDPNLDQVVDPNEPVVAAKAVVREGHIDIGPRIIDRDWRMLLRDDAVVPSVWRTLDDTVIQVTDAARRPVPNDPTYDFIGVEPGTQVHVVPQIQGPGVVWLGWNTQDPEVMGTIDRGATLTLRGVKGPGSMVVYLQSGNLAGPELLWDSTNPRRQPLFIDVNTHTHANWVFTQPGVYLVAVEASADLISGEEVSDTRLLRFAVGDATSTDAARAESYTIPDQPTSDGKDDAARGATGTGGGIPIGLLLAGAVALSLLIAGIAVRASRVKAKAERERSATEPARDRTLL